MFRLFWPIGNWCLHLSKASLNAQTPLRGLRPRSMLIHVMGVKNSDIGPLIPESGPSKTNPVFASPCQMQADQSGISIGIRLKMAGGDQSPSDRCLPKGVPDQTSKWARPEHRALIRQLLGLTSSGDSVITELAHIRLSHSQALSKSPS